MKKRLIYVLIFVAGLSSNAFSQESSGNLHVSSDLVSSYVWRGTKIGKGPAIQPGVEFTAGGFTLGAWGSYCISDAEALETDLYTSFTVGKFSLGLTDYYFPGTAWFNTSHHAFEINGGFSPGNFSLSVNTILNEGAGAAGGDVYVEAGITTGSVHLFAGGGSGWHTPDGEFKVCNLGLSTTREIKISDHFSLPLTGSVLLNPATEQLFVVAGITL